MDIKQAFCASAKKYCRMGDSQDYNDNHLNYTIDQIGLELNSEGDKINKQVNLYVYPCERFGGHRIG